MTREEKTAALLLKANALLEWFRGRPAPKVPFLIKPGTKIVNVNTYFESIRARMDNNRENPANRVFVCAYFDLLDLKIYMANEKGYIAADSEPAAVPGVGTAGN